MSARLVIEIPKVSGNDTLGITAQRIAALQKILEASHSVGACDNKVALEHSIVDAIAAMSNLLIELRNNREQ
jgi:hypothetical protein